MLLPNVDKHDDVLRNLKAAALLLLLVLLLESPT